MTLLLLTSAAPVLTIVLTATLPRLAGQSFPALPWTSRPALERLMWEPSILVMLELSIRAPAALAMRGVFGRYEAWMTQLDPRRRTKGYSWMFPYVGFRALDRSLDGELPMLFSALLGLAALRYAAFGLLAFWGLVHIPPALAASYCALSLLVGIATIAAVVNLAGRIATQSASVPATF